MSLYNDEYISDGLGLRVLSYNAIITAIVSNRTYGKTWLFKKRAFRRAMKHGRKTLWLRVFRNEAKECAMNFYSGAKLIKFCGVSMYDKETNPNGNCKQCGSVFYYRRKPSQKWTWFLKIACFSDAGKLRGFDDEKLDTIVADEIMKTKTQMARYHGDFINDMCDIFFSAKREHQVRIIALGNKEYINNPLYTYFNIKPLPHTFEGIRTYRDGSFVVLQVNNKQKGDTDYDNKVKALFKGTRYGNFIYGNQYKTQMPFKPRKTPQGATLYCQLIFNSLPLKIVCHNGFYYVSQKIDGSKRVYCDELKGKYKNELLLVRRQKRLFVSYENALADNRVYFDSEATFEAVQYFHKWLSI